MEQQPNVSVFWFRRDLRLDDNAGLYHALKSGLPVVPLFIFDADILSKLSDKTDKRVLFIHGEIERLNEELARYGSSLSVKMGKPLDVWKKLLHEFSIESVFYNHDYEPNAISRDKAVEELLQGKGVKVHSYKDQVIFEKNEVVKDDGSPYTVFTPYSRKWKEKLSPFYYKSYPVQNYASQFFKRTGETVPLLETLGFIKTEFTFPERKVKGAIIKNYNATRDYPGTEGTSRLGIHLRFGTLSIRRLVAYALERNQTYLNELIWREFYQIILFHFPYVVHGAFKPAYNQIEWQNNEGHFEAWCAGKTGYPIVDAGMRELNETGYMHNRVRMITASFLTKHLLIDWRWGEAYFAARLLDFELASNNGGWQWASGSGTDAAPYFRVFNPRLQMEKFDPDLKYVKRWVPEYGTPDYAKPIVVHEKAREKVMQAYKSALQDSSKNSVK
jgi:deoxyribodipyrimidine photo-lyase